MRVAANGIGIEITDQGLPGGEPLLLIMGLGMQLTGWPEELVQLLVSRGLRVLRMDNRDIGLSQYFDHLGVPNLAWAGLRHAMHLPVRAPYAIADMAQDALGVLDALGIARAHICGASMGGMIAQHLAAKHPQRVKSLTLMMTTTGSRRLPQPGLQVIGSPSYPADPVLLRARLLANVYRAWHPAGAVRQIVAVAADGDRSALVGRITAPTCVIHGQADPLVPVAAGHDLVARIPGATADMVPGMGHDLPLPLLPRFADAIAQNVARAG